MSQPEESARTLRVHIGRLVIDGRVGAESGGAIGESIESELAALLSNGAPLDAHGHAATSVAGRIAVSIAGRLDASGIQGHASPRSLDTPRRATNG